MAALKFDVFDVPILCRVAKPQSMMYLKLFIDNKSIFRILNWNKNSRVTLYRCLTNNVFFVFLIKHLTLHYLITLLIIYHCNFIPTYADLHFSHDLTK